mmetsp:Transcript_6994/g.29706  ORF Transcript_6994/g.29706 Transcript_6994/m.29706 type:complete len:373 (-) Transcript_6994:515-1633(-)
MLLHRLGESEVQGIARQRGRQQHEALPIGLQFRVTLQHQPETRLAIANEGCIQSAGEQFAQPAGLTDVTIDREQAARDRTVHGVSVAGAGNAADVLALEVLKAVEFELLPFQNDHPDRIVIDRLRVVEQRRTLAVVGHADQPAHAAQRHRIGPLPGHQLDVVLVAAVDLRTPQQIHQKARRSAGLGVDDRGIAVIAHHHEAVRPGSQRDDQKQADQRGATCRFQPQHDIHPMLLLALGVCRFPGRSIHPARHSMREKFRAAQTGQRCPRSSGGRQRAQGLLDVLLQVGHLLQPNREAHQGGTVEGQQQVAAAAHVVGHGQAHRPGPGVADAKQLQRIDEGVHLRRTILRAEHRREQTGGTTAANRPPMLMAR